MLYYGASDIGKKRETNQDGFYAGTPAEGFLLLAVCDGMGGANGGSVASSLALKTFVDTIVARLPLPESAEENRDRALCDLLRRAFATANDAVFRKASEDPALEGMGTTIVASLIHGGKAYCVHAGDSRIYLLEDKKLVRLTHDHSYVQLLIDMGEITPDEAERNPRRNIITRAVGTESAVEPDIFTREIGENVLLLCSDGLHGYVREDSIRRILLAPRDRTPESIVSRLIAAALRKGGGDNVTAVVALPET